MKIKVENQSFEAYRLITQKKYAKEIMSGLKTVEIRSFSDFYSDLFIDKAKQTVYDKYLENPDGSMSFDDMVKDIRFARLTNYSGSWFVDVEIYLPHICTLCQEDADFLKQSYGFEVEKSELEKYKDVPFEEKPMFFAIPLKRVVASEGL